MTTSTTSASVTPTATASNAGLKLAVQTVNLITKSKPQAPRKTITHVSDVATLSEQADALAKWASSFVANMQEWQARYNDALAYLASYPSTFNIELPSGLRASGKRLAQTLTHGGLVEDNKAIRKM